MEMQFIMDDGNLIAIAKERWRSQIPAIIDQAKIEAPHNTRLSNILQDLQSDEGKNCKIYWTINAKA